MNAIRHFKIGTRLALGFGLVLVMLVALSALSVERMSQLQARLVDIVRVGNDQVRQSNAMLVAINRTTALAREMAYAPTPAERDAAIATLGSARKSYDEAEGRLGELLKQNASAAEREIMASVAQQRTASRPLVDRMLRAIQAGKADEGRKILAEEAMPSQARWIAAVQKMVDLQDAEQAATADQAEKSYAVTRNVMIAASTLAVLLGAAAAWMLTLSITGPIGQAVKVAETVAGGDLTAEIPQGGRDEPAQLLDALRLMNGALASVVSQVREGSDSIATGSAEIANGNEDLSQRTEEQASNLQQTAASMEQLSGTVRTSADTARQATQLATTASDAAQEGGRMVMEVVDTMEGIRTSSRKVSDIIGVIDGIAFQTNILALNAAVEAARAGEQGRGFAVVAAEVRSLAQRSAEAAREIKALISDSVGKVESGSRLVGDAGRTMEDIVGQVRRVSDMIGEIAAAAGEQTQGIGQVSDAVTQLDQVTQQNAALVEQLAAAAGSLKSRSGDLVGAVASFKINQASVRSPVLAAPVAAPAAAPVAAAKAAAKPAPATAAARPAAAVRPAATAPNAARVAPKPMTAPAPAPVVASGGDDEWTQF